MTFYEFIQLRETWENLLDKEASKEFPEHRVIRQIKSVLKHKKYADFTERFLADFAIPNKTLLSKYNSSKKRTVYVYPGVYRLILKAMASFLLQNYNNKFCRNSIAYTEGRSVRSAFFLIERFNLKKTDIIYKTDFSDYFNSIDIDLLDEKLKTFLEGNIELHELIMRLLREPKVTYNNKVELVEQKGVMAGSPISGILANVFMHDVDMLMYNKRHRYIRYADDVLIVGKDAFDFFNEEISKLHVSINPKKTQVLNIETGITFLGFFHVGKIIDISPESKDKMKSRFRRRAKWYRQWMLRKNVSKEVTLRDYIKKINLKLYDDQDDSINWSRWYLPNINTIESIKYLDEYFVSCIRYLDSGTWTKGKKFYRLSYEDIKALGYKSLVNEYYRIKLKGRRQVTGNALLFLIKAKY